MLLEGGTNEAWDAICARRNVRQYTPQPVSADDLNHIAEAGPAGTVGQEPPAVGLRGPSPTGIQLEEWVDGLRGAGHIASAAAAIAIVVPLPPEDLQARHRHTTTSARPRWR